MIRNRSSISKIIMLLAMSAGLWLIAATVDAADIEIYQPKNEETVHNNDGNVTVEVMALLDPGYTIRLLIDGDRAAPDSRDLTFRLRGIERGEHTLQALILDERGYVVTRSQPVVFFMWQASSQFPSRVRPTPQAR
ncbi:MAG: hypothetical protein JSU95_16210 [Betaproteobacteria bacterium]|nr:MAG: hypothetical protein JSU95_16210 [Betaproteobacteria bacterium]